MKFIAPARIRFASWTLFETYALKMYPGRAANEIVETTMLTAKGNSCSELLNAMTLTTAITAPTTSDRSSKRTPMSGPLVSAIPNHLSRHYR